MKKMKNEELRMKNKDVCYSSFLVLHFKGSSFFILNS